MMKKILSLVLCLMMLFTGFAFAEEATDEMPATAEEAYEGVWVQFEDGFELYLPAEWVEIEVTEEMLEGGIFYVAASPDGAYTCQLAWTALEAETAIEDLQAELAVAYPDATLMVVNEIPMIVYSDAENDMLAAVAMDAAEPGVYMFCFTPASDADYMVLAGYIISSIRTFDVEAVAE